jgi:membrane protease YdiL (CAAX protease family)
MNSMLDRARPSVGAALGVYVGYLAIFFAVWIINDVDYMTIGATVESAKLHYALPTMLGSLFIAAAFTVTGGGALSCSMRTAAGLRWAWIGPITMFVLAVLGFATLHAENLTGEMVLWATLGGIGVGFGEEMITRGVLLTSLRDTVHRAAGGGSTLGVLGAAHPERVLRCADCGGAVSGRHDLYRRLAALGHAPTERHVAAADLSAWVLGLIGVRAPFHRIGGQPVGDPDLSDRECVRDWRSPSASPSALIRCAAGDRQMIRRLLKIALVWGSGAVRQWGSGAMRQ